MRFPIEENFAKELTLHCEINQTNVLSLISYLLYRWKSLNDGHRVYSKRKPE